MTSFGYIIPCLLLYCIYCQSLVFDAGSRRLGSNDFRNSSYKEKTSGSARVSSLSSVSYDHVFSLAVFTVVLLTCIFNKRVYKVSAP